jgi:hypothetical protein
VKQINREKKRAREKKRMEKEKKRKEGKGRMEGEGEGKDFRTLDVLSLGLFFSIRTTFDLLILNYYTPRTSTCKNHFRGI